MFIYCNVFRLYVYTFVYTSVLSCLIGLLAADLAP